jgi:C4-dicarboxylate-specific signal transduction histidine kinase
MTKHAVIEQAGVPCGALIFFPGAEPWNNTNAGENQYAGFVLDLTEKKPAVEARREMQMQIEHANRMATMGQLTASIVHEVSQPLGATILNAQAALRWLDSDQPNLMEAREALSRIVREATRASAVVRQIRNLSKKAPAREDRVDLNSAIRDVMEMTRTEVVENGVSVETELADGLPLVQGNRVELQQVMLNLIVNAVEAMKGVGRGSRELRIKTTASEDNEVLVSVRDTGPGLPPTSLKNLFKAFHTTKPDGLGLGLSICRAIVEAHGGRVWAKANARRGAVFEFALPARANCN